MSDAHARRRRNALWLHAHTKGMWDPLQDRVRRYPVDELAALWGVTAKSVRNGIAGALEDERKFHAATSE